MIQCNMTHVFLNYNMVAYEDPQILKERLAARGWRLWFLSQGLKNYLCICSNLDKEMRNFWFWGFWLITFWGAREVLGLVGEQDSKMKCSQSPEVGML